MARIVYFPDRPSSPAGPSASTSAGAVDGHPPASSEQSAAATSSASNPSSSASHPRSTRPPAQLAPPRAQRVRLSLPPIAVDASRTSSPSPSPSPTQRSRAPPTLSEGGETSRSGGELGHPRPPEPQSTSAAATAASALVSSSSSSGPLRTGRTIYDVPAPPSSSSSASVVSSGGGGVNWPSDSLDPLLERSSLASFVGASLAMPPPALTAGPPSASPARFGRPASSTFGRSASVPGPSTSATLASTSSTWFAPSASTAGYPPLAHATTSRPSTILTLGRRTAPTLPTLPLHILALVRTHLSNLRSPSNTLDGLLDHVALSRTCVALRAFYNCLPPVTVAGQVALEEDWWVGELGRCGFGLPKPVPRSPVCALLFYVRHLRQCRTEVLRPWLWATAFADQAGVDGLIIWGGGDGGTGEGEQPIESAQPSTAGGSGAAATVHDAHEAAEGSAREKRRKVRVEDLRGEWVRCCTTSGGVWPPTREDILLSSTVTTSTPPPSFPHPFLSDIALPLSPPPPASTDSLLSTARPLNGAFTLFTADDEAAAVGDHPGVAYQSATWPPARRVVVRFVWRALAGGAQSLTTGGGSSAGSGSKFKGKGKAGQPEVRGEWERGRATVVVERQPGEGPVTVADFLQGIAAYWLSDLGWDETKRLRLARPEIDTSTAEQRREKGSLNKRLGKLRRDYGRWAWLGDYTILTGFLPSTAADPITLTARLTTEQRYLDHYPSDDAIPPALLPAAGAFVMNEEGNGSRVGEGVSAGSSSTRRDQREESLNREDSGYAPSAATKDADDAARAGGPPSSP